jgi:acetyl-CoA acetyltransferase
MPYIEGRVVHDADAHIMETPNWLRDHADPAFRDRIEPLQLSGGNELRQTGDPEEQLRDLDHAGQVVVARKLWAKSDLTLADMDLLYPYDGFSIITLNWFENIGCCARGEGGDFVAQHWQDDEQRLLIDSRIPVNTHGGSLSEGGTQGAGHLREAILQLRGDAGPRQVEHARAAVTAVREQEPAE